MNKPKIKILSVGGRGANMLSRLDYLEDKEIERVAVGAKGAVFSEVPIKNKIILEKIDNLEEKDNIEIILEKNLEDKKSQIEKSVADVDALFIIGNLANEVSYYQIAQISKIAKDNGAVTFYVGRTPFLFEGREKIGLVQKNRDFIKNYVDAVLMIEGEKIMVKGLLVSKALTKTDELLEEIIVSLIDMVDKIGVINVDFADLKSTIENAGEVFFNSVSGERNDIPGLIKKLFEREDINVQKTNLDRVLYVVYANKDLLTNEIKTIGEEIQNNFGKDARVIFGIVHDDEMKDKIRIVFVGC